MRPIKETLSALARHHRTKFALVVTIVLSTTLMFQNCSGGFMGNDDSAFGRGLFNFDSSSDFANDKIDPNCMANSDFNACIFLKNPVAQKQQAIPTSLATTNLDSVQIFGVKIAGLATSGRLENSTFIIETVRGTPFDVRGTDLRVRSINDGDSRFSQVMTYYWLTRTKDYLLSRTGVFPALDKNIRVIVDDTVAGWSSRTNSIHLKLSDGGNPMAWSAELAIHFAGLANLHYATNGAISRVSTSTHRTCGLKTNGCCVSAMGCAKAIASGVGDYFAAMIFPDQPTVGEAWANNIQGLNICGLSRNLNTAASRTLSSAFSSCSSLGISGDTSTLGTIYASIFWEVRKQAKSVAATGEKDIDTIFMNHLGVLDGNDTFQTALSKIRNTDQRLFGGRYSDLFASEFSKRGIQ